MFAADFNQDGLIDLLAQDSIQVGLNLAFGETNGELSFGRAIFAENINSLSGKISVGDFNKDFIPDVVLVGANAYLFEGRANGNFKAPITYDAKYKIGYQNTSSQIADLNKDGFLDLVVTGNYSPTSTYTTNGTVTILYGSATRFSEAASQYYSVEQSPSSVITAEFNADA